MNTRSGSTTATRRSPRTPSRGPWVLGILLTIAFLPPQAHAALGKELSPNLVPHPPFEISMGAPYGLDNPPPYALRFSVTIANRGEVPLDFESEEDENDPAYVHAMQCTRWVAKRICTERTSTGEFVYHQAHGHYHITDFAKYELRRLNQDGQTPDMAPEALVAGGQKVSFCVQDTTYDSAKTLQAQNPIYTLCLEGKQGISPGWADTYGSGLQGQEIRTTGVPDGIYALVVTIDPSNRFFEGPREDNVSFTRIEITEAGTVAYEV